MVIIMSEKSKMKVYSLGECQDCSYVCERKKIVPQI